MGRVYGDPLFPYGMSKVLLWNTSTSIYGMQIRSTRLEGNGGRLSLSGDDTFKGLSFMVGKVLISITEMEIINQVIEEEN